MWTKVLHVRTVEVQLVVEAVAAACKKAGSFLGRILGVNVLIMFFQKATISLMCRTSLRNINTSFSLFTFKLRYITTC
jgi:hypothetical protein